ncbi:carbohydrate sulfotransferase 11 isoform X1 [Daphnia magna]|uniref:Carbohydrate sulfotransferase n=3 Tax=Daphnia magna TaxID=35525 RepID=A0A0P5QQK3_9CRUS|nr:carbohydrate sulfotransferase 11 isoform X1 [Daphnia magna]KAK4029950.1 hypothetical protein OUZ56_022906 [Daphnia magna]
MRLTPSRIVYAFLSVIVFLLVIQTLHTITNGLFAIDHGSSIPMEEIEQRMSQRLKQVAETCAKYKIRPDSVNSADYAIPHPPAPQYSVLYYQFQRKKTVYCPIYKAASTSMLHWLLSMKHINAEYEMKTRHRQISEVARQHYPSIDYPAAAELLKEAKKWMVVRHPFERILSAYRDKLENSTIGREHGTLHFYEKYGRKIVAKYRKATDNQDETRIEPTFAEFVSYLIDTDLTLYADDHWIPYYLFCTPCLINYDVIIQFETLQEDVQLLLNLIGEKRGPSWKHSASVGRSKTELIRSYYGQLSRETIGKLHDKYRIDFELFGYSIDGYLSI